MLTTGLEPTTPSPSVRRSSALATAGFLVVFVLLWLCLYLRRSNSPDSTPALNSSPLSIARQFFCGRYDLLQAGFRETGSSVFKFKLFWHTVYAVSGEDGRKLVFMSKDLDLREGFQTLSGAIPILAGVTSDLQAKSVALIHRRLGHVQSHEHLSMLIPKVTEDMRKILQTWNQCGALDPWNKIHGLIFQTTLRALASEEIADDTVLVARLKRLYDTLDRGNTPLAVLLPAFPSPSMVQNNWTTKKIYDVIMSSIRARQASGILRNDTLQMMLDQGTDPSVIAGFTMGLLVAGSRSTGTTASWLLAFLGSHSLWRGRVAAELAQLLASHATLPPSEAALSSRVSSVPLAAWERETPVLDAVLAETLRLAQPHVAMRRNLGPDVQVGEHRIPFGAYVVYPFADVHLDPHLYPDPWKFDPSRKPAQKQDLPYVGWGAGKVICGGQRLARLELKLLTALFVLGFEYDVVDDSGNSKVPRPDWNDTLMCRPADGPTWIKYKRTDVDL